MNQFGKTWLVTNPASGSNDEAALDELRTCLDRFDFDVAGETNFPDDDLPEAKALADKGVGLVIVYTGDGTLNAIISKLSGWGGSILVLPGGTMNLLSKRLHGDVTPEDILKIVADGGALPRRISIVQASCGIALAGLLVGPGTCWSNVREAMRDFDLVGMAGGAVEALGKTTEDAPVRAVDPELGRSEGYPLLEMTPGEHGIRLDGFYAETAAQFAQQGWALLRRSFREGPHDRLGVVEEVTLASTDGSPLQMLLDGEPCEAGSRETFTVAACGVDLLATGHGD